MPGLEQPIISQVPPLPLSTQVPQKQSEPLVQVAPLLQLPPDELPLPLPLPLEEPLDEPPESERHVVQQLPLEQTPLTPPDVMHA